MNKKKIILGVAITDRIELNYIFKRGLNGRKF